MPRRHGRRASLVVLIVIIAVARGAVGAARNEGFIFSLILSVFDAFGAMRGAVGRRYAENPPKLP